MKILKTMVVGLLLLPFIASADKRIHNRSGRTVNVRARYYGRSVLSCRDDYVTIANGATAAIQPYACVLSWLQADGGVRYQDPRGDDFYVLSTGHIVNQSIYQKISH